MQRLFLVWLVFMIPVTVLPQSSKEKISVILNRIGKSMPPDKVYLHLDRNLYYAGDTIRFKAYIRTWQTGVFETKSLSLFALLLNSDHVTIDSSRFRISYSTTSGWLRVPETIPAGDYSILAFTSDQMNYTPEFAFRTPVRIDKRRSDGVKNEASDSRPKSTYDLRFLPEGGTFIYGIRQRLAFNAVTPDGRIQKVSGEIINQKGEKITEFISGTYGPGIIEFTPLEGDTYYAKPVEQASGNLSWPLPQPEKSGVALRVNNAGRGLVDIILREKITLEKEYFLTVTMNNILIFSRDIKSDTLFSARINTGEIPCGTAVVTLYDKELNPLAERLIFLNDHKKMNIQMGISPSDHSPGDETELTINTTDVDGNNVSSIVSVSVIDSLSGYHSGIPLPDIESVFLYDPEFYNNLPQSIRCNGLSGIDSKSIDLLLMTYGWRKYTLKEAELVAQAGRTDNYDHLKISNPGPEKKGRREINIISPEGGRAIILSVDKNREAILPFDSLEAVVRQIMILPDNDPSRNSNPVTIDFPGNREYTDKAKLIVTDSCYSLRDIAPIEINQSVTFPDSTVLIEAVTIKGQRKPLNAYADKKADQFRYSGTYTLFSKDFSDVSTFEDILYRVGAFYVDKNKKVIVLRPIGRLGRGLIPALFVVDDVPIMDRTYLPIASMLTSQIASVTILRGHEGFGRYGNEAFGGVVFVTTKGWNRLNDIISVDNEEDQNQNDNPLKYIRLFCSEVEYYIPSKEEVNLIPEYNFRPTILWKENLFIDGSGPVKINYPNNLVKSSAMIFINGTSFTNLIGSKRLSYKIK